MLTVRSVDFFACDEHGELALRGWPAVQAWSHATVLRQELSVCNIVACTVSSGRARPSASGSDWARACGQAQARARNAGAFVYGPHATRALRARGALEEYAERRSINAHGDALHRRRKASRISQTQLAFGLGSVQPPDRILCLPMSCVCACQNSRRAHTAACAPGRTAALHTRAARRAVSNVHGNAHCMRGRHRAGTPHEGAMPFAGPGGEPCRPRHERHGGCRDQHAMNRVSVHFAIQRGRS